MNKDDFAPIWNGMTPQKRMEIMNQVCTGCFKEKRATKKAYSERTWGYLGEFLRARIVCEYERGYLPIATNNQ